MIAKFFITAVLWAFASIASAQAVIKKGDVAKVPGHEWVKVLNPEPVASGNNEFSYGETCSINETGKVTAVGFMSEGGEELVLVRYSIPGQAFGAPCPSGVVFFTSKKRFHAMTAEHERAKATEAKGRARIAEILSGK
ncbi:MAG: hypothetical protein IPJ68_00705 [Candidatus Moraniibacteriota bacterium]|nr:MAG: hypothetical protein IPJ68_00705 [Candidatus Moranbacteria bacterium]